jgi:hypothetical protein
MLPAPVEPMEGKGPKGASHLSGELQFVLIICAILMVLVFAGLPIGPVKDAGDGSWKLRHGWAARQRALHAAREATSAHEAQRAEQGQAYGASGAAAAAGDSAPRR